MQETDRKRKIKNEIHKKHGMEIQTNERDGKIDL